MILVLALANCIVKVERAFTLWATGAIEIEVLEDSHEKKNKVITLKPVLNKVMGKMSLSALHFMELNWGVAMCSYAKLARTNLDSGRFLEILEMSRALIKGKSVNKHCEPTIDIEDDDPRANLIDLVEKPEESTTAYLISQSQS